MASDTALLKEIRTSLVNLFKPNTNNMVDEKTQKEAKRAYELIKKLNEHIRDPSLKKDKEILELLKRARNKQRVKERVEREREERENEKARQMVVRSKSPKKPTVKRTLAKQELIGAENWGPLLSSKSPMKSETDESTAVIVQDDPESEYQQASKELREEMDKPKHAKSEISDEDEQVEHLDLPPPSASKESEPPSKEKPKEPSASQEQPQVPPSTLQVWLATLGISPALFSEPGALWKYLQPLVEQYKQLSPYQQDIINNIIIKGGLAAAIFGSLYGVGKVSRKAFKNWYETRKSYVKELYPRRIPIINQLESEYKRTPVGRKKFRIFKKLLHVITDKPIVRQRPLQLRMRRPEETVVDVVDKRSVAKRSSSSRILKRRKGRAKK